jgi:hypothetical protein
MRTTVLACAIALSFSAAGQTADRLFYFAHTGDPQNMQEVATLVRTIADIPQLSVNTAQRSMTVRADPERIALTEWLLKRLDQPLPEQGNSDANEFKLSATPENIVHLVYLTNHQSVKEFQEIATVARTIADIRRVFTYNAPLAMVLRGTADQIALATWVVSEMDKPLEAPLRHSAVDEYRVPPSSDDVTRVFTLAHAETIQDFQEVATLIRTMADIRRVFTYNELRAITLRGTPDQIAMAEWLFDVIDRPANAQSTGEFRVPKASDDVVRVYYLTNTRTVQDFQQAATEIRTATNIRRVFTYNSRRALALRGTTDQLARAERMITGGAQ